MNEQRYLSWPQKMAYGTGDFAANCSYALITTFVMIYLTDTIGLNPGIIGILIGVSKLLDGVTDIFFGTIIDRTKSKMGKARPWMLFSQIGVLVSLMLLFLVPMGISENLQYAYFFVVYTALNSIFYTANNIAYSTLTALITRNVNERVQLGSIRFVFAMLAGLVVQTFTISFVTKLGGGAAGWRSVAFIVNIINVFVALNLNIPLMLITAFIKGLFTGPMMGTINALIAEASLYTFKTKGVHLDGTMYSCSSLGMKLGGGIGSAFAGLMLNIGGYDGLAKVQSASAISMISFMFIWIPLIVTGILTVSLYLLKVEQANIDLEDKDLSKKLVG